MSIHIHSWGSLLIVLIWTKIILKREGERERNTEREREKERGREGEREEDEEKKKKNTFSDSEKTGERTDDDVTN